MVSIITVNYNGYKDTCELIDSLSKYETYPYEIIVVDNASSGDDAIKLHEKYPTICVVSSNINRGFAGGNNLGYVYAKGDYVIFLNNDTIIKYSFLEPLVKKLDTTHCGLVSPKIMYEEAPDRIQFAGFTSLSSITVRNSTIGTGEKDNGQYDTSSLTPYVHGAAMMGRKDIIDKVGLMTEIYFLFYEELDWSERFKDAGYQLWYEPASVIFHKEGMTAKLGTPLRLYYMTRGRLLFVRRNLKGLVKILSCLYLSTIVLLKNTITFAIQAEWGMLPSLWKGTWSGIHSNRIGQSIG